MQHSVLWRLPVFALALTLPLSAFGGAAISEVLWMGSDLSTADEWVELGCGGTEGTEDSEDSEDSEESEVCELGGFKMTVLGSTGQESVIAQIPIGTMLGVGQYFLIANYDAAHSRLARDADLISTSMSLPNSKLFLRLYDGSGTLIDEVDDGVGAPFAGMNASGTGARASMERVSILASGRAKENWITSDNFLGLDEGSPMKGTPGFANEPAQVVSSQPPIFTGALVTSSGSSVPVEPTKNVAEVPSTQTGIVILPRVVLTEVLPNPVGSDDQEWIEIANLGSGAVSVAGWKLQVRTAAASPRTFTIPADTGSVLLPGAHRSFRATETALPLRNAGDRLSLLSGATVLDTWEYPELPEGIAFGRDATISDRLGPRCLPTEGSVNSADFLDVMIDLQSGETSGIGSVTLNLDLRVLSGSLAGGSCHWDFGDGYVSESCNPPSHAIKAAGSYSVLLEAKKYCDTTVERRLSVEITLKSRGQTKTVSNSDSPSCAVLTYTGVVLSEVLPNPSGDEAEEEWIELYNTGPDGASLCGWQLDDAEEGSAPYALDGLSIAGGDRLVVHRRDSKIALNNDGDTVRLFAPLRMKQGDSFKRAEQQTISFIDAPNDESWVRRDDGLWVWSPVRTPGEANAWRTADRALDLAHVIVSAALPNPTGEDGPGEWIELQNRGSEAAQLQGWKLSTARSTKKISLDDISLEPLQTTRIELFKHKLGLTNTADAVLLLAPDSSVVSVLDWVNADEAKIYRPPVLDAGRVPALVTQVLSGDQLEVFLINPEDRDLPDSIQRAWLAAGALRTPVLRVHLLGIEAPLANHPHQAFAQFGAEAHAILKQRIEGRTIDLSFDRDPWLGSDQVAAYVHASTSDDTVQAQLLRQGLALANQSDFSLRLPYYQALQQEAQKARLGLWADPEATAVAEALQEGLTTAAIVLREGIGLRISPGSGLVASGTVVTIQPSVHSSVFVSLNSGAFVAFSGSLTLTDDLRVRAYAVWNDALSQSGGVVRSPLMESWYVLKQDSYSSGIVISEVHPSPPPASKPCVLPTAYCKGEWIELYNPTEVAVSLAAWQLDDAEGGSKPLLLGPDVTVPPHAYVVVILSGSSLALNNDGDSVRLLSPDGLLSKDFGFDKVKTNFVMAYVDQRWCLSQIPSPGAPNICYVFAEDAPDADQDLLPDDRETYVYHTDPQNADTDSDGWSDGFEVTLVASAAEFRGPLIADAESRALQLAYQSFSLEHLRPKARAYVRKGLVFTTKPYPVARALYARATPSGSWHSLEHAEDGTWTIQFPETFRAGTVPIDLRVREASGREVILHAATQVVLNRTTPSVMVASLRQTGRMAGRSLRRKYVPVYGQDGLAQVAESLPGVYVSLLARAFFGDQPSSYSFRFPLFEAVLLLVCLSAAGWCLREWWRHPDIAAARKRRKAQAGGKT